MNRIMLSSPQQNPRFTQEDLDFLVENNKTKTPQEIGDCLKKSKQTIYMQLKKYGLIPCVNRPIKSRVVVYKKEVIVSVIEDYVTTQDSLKTIGKRHNVDQARISNWIRDCYFGVPKNENAMMIRLESQV